MVITIHHVIWHVSFRKCPFCHHVIEITHRVVGADVSAEEYRYKGEGRVPKPMGALK